jgi:hypothetical protein
MMRYIQNEFSKVHNRGFTYEGEFKTIIVSSLKAVPNFILSNLGVIIERRNRIIVNLWEKEW